MDNKNDSELRRGCILVCAMFVINFLQAGIVKALGVYLDFMRQDLESSTAAIGFVYGIPSALAYILAPAGICLGKHFGFRPCMMLGGLLTTIGWGAASTFATSVAHLGICFGLVGIGVGLIIVPANLAIVPHFERHLAFANSVGHSGLVCGLIVVPPLAEFLRDLYGWRGSLLILSGIVFHMCAVAALLKPQLFVPDPGHYQTIPEYSSIAPTRKNSVSESHLLSNHSLQNLRCLNFQVIFTRPLLMIHLGIFALLGLSVLTWAVFLVPHAVDSGIPINKAVYLSSTGGIGGLLGHLHQGPIVDRKWLTSSQVYLYMTVSNIMAVVLDYFIPAFPMKVLAAFISGFTLLGRGPLRVPMIAEIKEDVDFATYLSLSYFFYGVTSLPGTTLAGWIHDITGNYRYSILFIGLVETVATLLVITSILLGRSKV